MANMGFTKAIMKLAEKGPSSIHKTASETIHSFHPAEGWNSLESLSLQHDPEWQAIFQLANHASAAKALAESATVRTSH